MHYVHIVYTATTVQKRSGRMSLFIDSDPANFREEYLWRSQIKLHAVSSTTDDFELQGDLHD